MRNQPSDELPESWKWTTLGEIGEVVSGGTPSTKDSSNFNGDVEWITPADLSGYDKKLISGGSRKLSQRGLNSCSAKLIPAGTILFSSRAPIGYAAIAANECSTNQGFKNLIPNPEILNEYIYYYLKASKRLAEQLASGTTFKEISGTKFSRLPIPIAPKNEQRRIVNKLEELLTDLDAAVLELRVALTRLRRYRQSVYKAAVTGELSKQWREVNKDELDAPSELVSRILKSRRAEWEAKELSRMTASGKPSANENWTAKYKEPASVQITDLPTLPKGWQWINLDMVLSRIEAGKSFKCEERPPSEREVGVVKVSAVTWGEFNETESKTCLSQGLIEKNLFIQCGDFLFSRANTIQLVGAVVLVRKAPQRNLMLSDKTLRFHFLIVEPKWFLLTLRSNVGRNEIERLSTGNQESMRNIGQDRIRQIRIPLPSLKEIGVILSEFDRLMSITEAIEHGIKCSLKEAERLRQSILKNAFAGQLVSQDSNDEPAEVLLERIKLERAKREAEKQETAKENRQKRLSKKPTKRRERVVA